MSFTGGGEQECNRSSVPFFPLDDPVLEAVKCHLPIGSRISFEAISRRFARIAFFVKSRMSLKSVGYRHDLWNFPKSSWQLLVNRRESKNDQPFDVAVNDVERVVRSLFLRIRKWRSVTVAPGHEAARYMDDHIISQLLDAILVDESRPVIDIRRFSCGDLSEKLQGKLAEFLQRCTPFLRYLFLGLTGIAPQPVLELAIGACRKLRRLALAEIWTNESGSYFSPSFLPMLVGLEKVDGLLISVFRDLAQMEIAHRCLVVEDGWLPLFAQPALFPLLKQMQRLDVLFADFGREELAVPYACLAQIVAEMRSPADIVITANKEQVEWPTIWDVFLPMVHGTRATVLITQPYGLRELTAEALASGVSTLPAIVQTALAAPDLPPIEEGQQRYYWEVNFHFSTGGRLTVKREHEAWTDVDEDEE